MTDRTYEAESLHTPDSRERDARFVGHEVNQETSKERVERHCAKIVSHVSEGRSLWDSDFAGIIDTLRGLLAERDFQTERLRIAIKRAESAEDERDALKAENARLRKECSDLWRSRMDPYEKPPQVQTAAGFLIDDLLHFHREIATAISQASAALKGDTDD